MIGGIGCLYREKKFRKRLDLLPFCNTPLDRP
jgi:hypothetical protein